MMSLPAPKRQLQQVHNEGFTEPLTEHFAIDIYGLANSILSKPKEKNFEVCARGHVSTIC